MWNGINSPINTSKTANLDIISIHIHMYYVYSWWLLSNQAGGECPSLHPPLNETLHMHPCKIAVENKVDAIPYRFLAIDR